MIKLLQRLGLFILLCTASACAATPCYVSLQGTVQIPNAANFNGVFTLQMMKVGVKSTVSPYLTVPTSQITYPIKNGQLIGVSSGNFLSQDCMKPRVPYDIQILDAQNNLVASDNWYLPNVESGTVDIGNMQEEKFNGPITVSIPQGIISTPLGNQTITQPAGTSLTINGTVNFTGTINYTTPPAFTTITANQILVNGVISSSYPIDVNGIINDSAGYCVAGCAGATVGQALLYNGVAFVPGTVTVAPPTLHYQTISYGGIAQTQRNAIAFDTSSFGTPVDSASPSTTTIKLLPVGTAGTYVNITSLQTDIYGRVLGVTTGTIGSLAKAILSFNGTGTSPTILASNNIASVVRTVGGSPTGDYTVTFTIAMSSANYVVAISNIAHNAFSSSYETATLATAAEGASDPTVSSFRIICAGPAGSSNQDLPRVDVVVY
jgi:hypothetical protein